LNSHAEFWRQLLREVGAEASTYIVHDAETGERLDGTASEALVRACAAALVREGLGEQHSTGVLAFREDDVWRHVRVRDVSAYHLARDLRAVRVCVESAGGNEPRDAPGARTN